MSSTGFTPLSVWLRKPINLEGPERHFFCCCAKLTITLYNFLSKYILPYRSFLTCRSWILEYGFIFKIAFDLVSNDFVLTFRLSFQQRGLYDCNGTRTHNHLVRKRTFNCFEQGVPWDSGNYRVWIFSETRTWHDKNIQLKRFIN